MNLQQKRVISSGLLEVNQHPCPWQLGKPPRCLGHTPDEPARGRALGHPEARAGSRGPGACRPLFVGVAPAQSPPLEPNLPARSLKVGDAAGVHSPRGQSVLPGEVVSLGPLGYEVGHRARAGIDML